MKSGTGLSRANLGGERNVRHHSLAVLRDVRSQLRQQVLPVFALCRVISNSISLMHAHQSYLDIERVHGNVERRIVPFHLLLAVGLAAGSAGRTTLLQATSPSQDNDQQNNDEAGNDSQADCDGCRVKPSRATY
jgi:hypothetical protein